jgi:predicted metal-binding protein
MGEDEPAEKRERLKETGGRSKQSRSSDKLPEWMDGLLKEVVGKYPLLKNYEVRKISPNELELDVKTRWKCAFGCEYYGKRKSCPPFVPDLDEAEKFLKSYTLGFLLKVNYDGIDYMETKKQIQKLLIEIEGKLVKKHPMVFTLFPGGCDLCDECRQDEGCRARPTVSSLGIRISDLGVELGDKWLVSMILLE